MYQKRTLTISVHCPADPKRIETMQISQIMLDAGWFPAPCNGCDDMCGSSVCTECCQALTSMFFRDPDMDISQPITPRLQAAAE